MKYATCHISRSLRRAFTLLELITAMLASTALVVALAATLAISTQMLQTPPDDRSTWRDQNISDRIARDLRYATQVREVADGFEITAPRSSDGVLRKVTYESGVDGLTRQVDGQSAFALESQQAKFLLDVDGYSAPTNPTPDRCVRVRSYTTVANDNLDTSWVLDVPPGTQSGDLVLLCMSARLLSSLTISGSDWSVLSFDYTSDIRLIVASKTFDHSWDSGVTLSSRAASSVAAALVTLENADSGTPFPWATTQQGYAYTSSSATFPQVRESSDIKARQLNLQVFAAENDPWHDGAIGLAGFAEVLQVTAMPGDNSYRNTLAIAVRNGPTPTMSSVPRPNHQSSGYWLQSSATVELSE